MRNRVMLMVCYGILIVTAITYCIICAIHIGTSLHDAFTVEYYWDFFAVSYIWDIFNGVLLLSMMLHVLGTVLSLHSSKRINLMCNMIIISCLAIIVTDIARYLVLNYFGFRIIGFTSVASSAASIIIKAIINHDTRIRSVVMKNKNIILFIRHLMKEAS